MGSAFCTNGCCSSYTGGCSLAGKTFPVQPGFHRVPFLLEGLRHRARFLVGQANWRGSGRDAGSAWGVHGGGLPGACFHSHGRKRRLGRRRRAGIRTRGWRAAGVGRVPRSGCRGQRSSGPRFLRPPGPLAGRLLGGRCFSPFMSARGRELPAQGRGPRTMRRFLPPGPPRPRARSPPRDRREVGRSPAGRAGTAGRAPGYGGGRGGAVGRGGGGPALAQRQLVGVCPFQARRARGSRGSAKVPGRAVHSILHRPPRNCAAGLQRPRVSSPPGPVLGAGIQQ